MPVENVGAIDEESASGFDVDKNQQYRQMRHEVYHNFQTVSQDLLKESGNILRNVGESCNHFYVSKTRNVYLLGFKN